MDMKRRKKRILVVLYLMAAFLMTACADRRFPESGPVSEPVRAAGEETVCFTDDLGMEFSIERPRRVVAMIGSFADIWLLAGGEESLVGTAADAWESYELDLPSSVVNIGSGMKPSSELVFAAEPDLVLASTISSSNLELRELFAQAGIPAAYFDVASFDDYLRLLKLFTELTGKPELYEIYGETIKRQVDQALAQADGSSPKVLSLQVSGKSCTVKNSEGNILGEMLLDLGCRNIADRKKALLEDLSLETIIQEDPDYIFAVYHGTDTEGAQKNLEQTLLSDPAWQGLKAVREGRFYVLERRMFNLKPNALWGEAYEKLADILYEEP